LHQQRSDGGIIQDRVIADNPVDDQARMGQQAIIRL
ncbi:MAG: hypothetical protein JWO78_878, partial [Micavibrio sp.]|nr:hypothetical protein [Micavibrio sp.]